jgi:TfoX/Sxy family transcriptional regulator of competence genes
MATDAGFINYVCEQISSAGEIRAKKMFGDYMAYCDDRPVFLVCDNTVFVKMLPETAEILASHGKIPETGFPYKGAKEHYAIDIDDAELAVDMARTLARILPVPKPRKSKKDR